MYYSLRVTPEEFNIPWNEALALVATYFIKDGRCDADGYITADESINKFGESAKRHFHFNFTSDKKKDTIQKGIRTFYSERGYVCKGNRCYSLQQLEEPEDYDRWFRYCMKEKYIKKLTRSSEVDFEKLELLAKDERKQAIKHNLANRAKLLDKNTLYDKIVMDLVKQDPRPADFKSIWSFIVAYYVKEKKPVNLTTIKGYTITYCISEKLITSDMLYEKYGKI